MYEREPTPEAVEEIRAHLASTHDQTDFDLLRDVACPGRRCGCSYQILVPGYLPGRTRMLTIQGTITEARAAKRSHQAAGRPQSPVAHVADETLDAFAGRYLRAKAGVFSPHTTKSIETEYRLRISPRSGTCD